jgi:hypothetical protein
MSFIFVYLNLFPGCAERSIGRNRLPTAASNYGQVVDPSQLSQEKAGRTYVEVGTHGFPCRSGCDMPIIPTWIPTLERTSTAETLVESFKESFSHPTSHAPSPSVVYQPVRIEAASKPDAARAATAASASKHLQLHRQLANARPSPSRGSNGYIVHIF